MSLLRSVVCVVLVVLSLVFAGASRAGERPEAAAGFQWKSFPELHCDIQIPDGWHERRTTSGITEVIQISPAALKAGEFMQTGFTMNTVRTRNSEQWNEALASAAKMMGDIRDAVPDPIQSTVKEDEDMLVMIVEGVRTIPAGTAGEYHVRTVVRAFPKKGMVYIYSFGAPAGEWEEAWKSGFTMLNPLWFNLPD